MDSLGKHLITEFYGCDAHIMDDVARVEQAMVCAAKAADATVVSVSFHHFSPYGVSGVVVIQESHLTVHTWPEYGFAAVDLFTCGDTTDPWKAFKSLEETFGSDHSSTTEISRGMRQLLEHKGFVPEKIHHKPLHSSPHRQNWFTERDGELALSFGYETLLHRRQTRFQSLEVYSTSVFGNVLTINGQISTTERDESAYHEMAVHVPMSLSPRAKSVLILGGGDGGMASECLKYHQLEQIMVVEQDQEVAELSQQYFPRIASSLQSSRVQLKYTDADTFLKSGLSERFDVIILDGLSSSISWQELHQLASKLLTDNGLYITSIGSPTLSPQLFKDHISALSTAFTHTYPYSTFLPSCPTGMWMFALATSQSVDPYSPIVLEEADFGYYNQEVHTAAFALPNFVRKLFEKAVNQ